MELFGVDARVVAAVAVLVVAVLGGAAVLLTDGETVRPVDTVPDADAVAVVEGDLLTHPTTRRLANETLARSGTGTTYDRLLADVERGIGLDAERVRWVAAFARYPNRTTLGGGGGYAGVVLRAEFSEADLVSSVEEGDLELKRRADGGFPVYRLRGAGLDTYVAVLGPDTYAFSTREAVVTDAVAVRTGNASGLSEGLRTALTQRRSAAVVRAAATVPVTRLESIAGSGAGRLGGVERVGVGYEAINETHVGVRATLYAESAGEAEDLRQLLSAGQVLVGTRLRNDTVERTVRGVGIRQDGTSVTLSYRDSVTGVIALGEGLSTLAGAVPVPLRVETDRGGGQPPVATLTTGGREGRT
jgi:hypothetical protein